MPRRLLPALASAITLNALAITAFTPAALAQDIGPAMQAARQPATAHLGTELSAEEAAADIEVARQALALIHPGYTRYATLEELDQAWDRLHADARHGMRSDALYLGLSALLTQIRCDHTKAELPETMEAARAEIATHLPFRFRVFDGRMIVDEPGTSGLERGEEILTIDGVSASQRMEAARRFIPVDGYTDHVKDSALAETAEFLGSGFDHFDPLLRPDDEEVRLEVLGLDGQRRELTLPRLTYAQWRTLSGDSRRYRNFSDPDMVRVEYLDANTARLNVDTFVNYRTPVDPASVYDPVFQALNQRGITRLILDLRRNGGGSTDAQQGLLAYLIDAPIRPVREVRVATNDFTPVADYIDTWDRSVLDPDPAWFTPLDDGLYRLDAQIAGTASPIAPADHRFRGEIAVLTGPTNASGATQIIGALREQERAILIGEPTGGSQEGPTAGIIFFVELPASGVRVRVPVQWSIQARSDPEPGLGFAPDVLAPQTYDAWLAGIDPALNAARDWARR